MIYTLRGVFAYYINNIILFVFTFFKILANPSLLFKNRQQLLNIFLYQKYRNISQLIRLKKTKKALKKIIKLKDRSLNGWIGITKSFLYSFNGEYQKATQLAQKMIPLIEKTDKYNQADKEYLTFYLKDIMLDCEVTSKENFEKLKLELVNWYIDLSKVDKILMREFPMRDLGNWYKHNPKDEYYEKTIAKYGEE